MKNDRSPFCRALLLMLCLALLGSLSGCAVRPKAARTETGEKLFRLGFSGESGSMNPFEADTPCGEMALALLYDTLLTRDADTGEIRGSLCTDYTVEVSASGCKRWTLHLRDGAVWSDGEPVTASDVEFSLQSQSWFSRLYYSDISESIDTVGISVTDEHTLVFLAWGGDAAVAELLTRIPILPRHIWNGVEGMGFDPHGLPASLEAASEALAAMPVNGQTMVSSGGYTFVSLSEDRIALRYRREDVPCAAEAVELIWGLSDPAASLAEGEIDGYYHASQSTAAENGLNEGYYGAELPSDTVFLLEFDQRETGSSPMKDASLRKAVSLALDREKLMALLGGTPFPPTEENTSEKARISTAVELLEKAGYRDTDGDGWRSSGTEKLTLCLAFPDSPGWSAAAEEIQRELSLVGLAVSLCPTEEGEHTSVFDLRLTCADGDDAYAMFYWNGGAGSLCRTDAFDRAVSPGRNGSGFASDGYDLLYERLSLAETEKQREELRNELRKLLQEQNGGVLLGRGSLSQRCSPAWRWGNGGELDRLIFAPSTILQRFLHFKSR